jgi:hypothetical protein
VCFRNETGLFLATWISTIRVTGRDTVTCLFSAVDIFDLACTAGSTLLPGLGTEAWLVCENMGSTLKRNISCSVPPERVSGHKLRTAA